MDAQQHLAVSSEQLPTLRDIATPLFRHPKLVLFTFGGLILATILVVTLLPKSYQATMKLLVKRERIDAAVSPGRDEALATPGEVTEEEVNSEVELLRSRDLLEQVVLACKLQEVPAPPYWTHLFPTVSAHEAANDDRDIRSISRAVAALESKLQIEPLKKTDLIQVTYDSPDPKLAASVLTMLSNLYLEKTVAVHRPPGAFEFFQTESQHYSEELHAAETRLTEFDQQNGVADPQLEKQAALQQLAQFESTFQATQVAIKEAEKRSEAVEKQLAATPEQTIFQVRTSENPYLMEQLRTTLLNLQLKRTVLDDNFQSDYRPLQDVQQQIDQTLSSIAQAEKAPTREETTDRNPAYDWLQSELTKSNADLAGLHARASETLSVILHYKKQLGVIDVDGAAQDNLVREVKEAESNYLLYLQKREEARIADALDRQRIVNVAIAEAATVPALPVTPRRALILLLGTLLACVAGPVVAFVVDYFDPSLRTPDELESMQIPLLAALPRGAR